MLDYKNHLRNDSEISDLIYAKVDEILSPANGMNGHLASNSSINIFAFNVSVFFFFLILINLIYPEIK